MIEKSSLKRQINLKKPNKISWIIIIYLALSKDEVSKRFQET